MKVYLSEKRYILSYGFPLPFMALKTLNDFTKKADGRYKAFIGDIAFEWDGAFPEKAALEATLDFLELKGLITSGEDEGKKYYAISPVGRLAIQSFTEKLKTVFSELDSFFE